MITLAFYMGRGATRRQRLEDWMIRSATRGRYSHVELIGGSAKHGEIAECLSSSGRDGGVRAKHILMCKECWDLVELSVDPTQPVRFIKERAGAKYDYAGILLSHVLAIGRHDESRWFCSEICAAALGIRNPQCISPQMLFEIVTWGQKGV